jgi:hypothetical protein
MPPKGKKKSEEDESLMKAARFGRVKNDLSMGFVGLPNVSLGLICLAIAATLLHVVNFTFDYRRF